MTQLTPEEKKKLIINLLLILCSVIIVVLGAMMIKSLLEYRESRKEYDVLQEYTFVEEDEAESAKPSAEKTEPVKENTDTAGNAATKENPEKDESGKILVKKEPTCALSIDFASLQEVNPDVKGWIYMDELNISYPIVQGENNDEYIYTTVMGTANNSGSIFMESLNAGDFSDSHTLIYGHNMKDGSMFGKLKRLYDQDYIDKMEEIPAFWVITPTGKYRYDIFSIHTTPASGETYTIYSGESNEVADYMNSMAKKSGVELSKRTYNSTDKVITLSTCTGSDEYRLVVQGVLHVD